VSNPKCNSCRWWKAEGFKSRDIAYEGRCHFHAPSSLNTDAEDFAWFPLTHPDDFCAQHAPVPAQNNQKC
jgi:hypothetical protein